MFYFQSHLTSLQDQTHPLKILNFVRILEFVSVVTINQVIALFVKTTNYVETFFHCFPAKSEFTAHQYVFYNTATYKHNTPQRLRLHLTSLTNFNTPTSRLTISFFAIKNSFPTHLSVANT